MIRITPIIFTIILLFYGCASVPETIVMNGKEVKAHSAFSVNCKKPYLLTQDCGRASQAKRVTTIGGVDVKIAGSEDGHIVLVMNNKSLKVNSGKLKEVSNHILQIGIELGLELQSMEVSWLSGEIEGFYAVFDGDIYTHLKTLSKNQVPGKS